MNTETIKETGRCKAHELLQKCIGCSYDQMELQLDITYFLGIELLSLPRSLS